MHSRTVVVMLCILILVCSCGPGEAVVIVEDRWWTSYTLVQYTDVDVSVTIDEDGFPHTTTTTSTETRCRAEKSGRTLPVEYPLPACIQWWGDFITYRAEFYILYHEQETQDGVIKQFTPTLWSRLEPGTESRIKWGLLGVVSEVAATR